jgi:hypothetical protein
MSLELDPKNVKSHVLLTLSTCKYCDTKVQQHATANGRSLSCESPVMRWVGLVVVVLTLVVRLRQAAITGKVEIKESWGKKLYQLEMGILTIEYGKHGRFV